MPVSFFLFFFFNDTATTEIYTLSLHDALPISLPKGVARVGCTAEILDVVKRYEDGRMDILTAGRAPFRDRKSTRLNSSHGYISYAVFCLKKKTKQRKRTTRYNSLA